MKKEDIKKLKFTNFYWATLSSKAQVGYMLGFKKCQSEVLKLLEKENEKNKH